MTFNLINGIQRKKDPDLFSVFSQIRERGPVSRMMLRDLTGLKQSTLVRIIGELLEAGYIRDDCMGPSNGGRKPVLMTVNPEAAYTIGIDITGTHIRIALLDLSCSPIRSNAIHFPRDSAPEALLQKVSAIAGELGREVDAGRILGVGVGIPGPVDREEGMASTAVLFQGDGAEMMPIREIITRNTGWTAIVESSGRAAAYGEYRNGYLKRYSDVVYISAGEQLDLGIIANGRPAGGTGGCNAGFGHIRVERDGLPCSCGGTGCLAAYVTIPVLLKKMAEGAGRGWNLPGSGASPLYPLQASFDALCKAVEMGNEKAVELIDSAAVHFAAGLATVVRILDPEAVVLGGTLIQRCHRFYTRSVHLAAKRLYGHEGTHGACFFKGALEENAVVVGMGNLVLDRLLKV